MEKNMKKLWKKRRIKNYEKKCARKSHHANSMSPRPCLSPSELGVAMGSTSEAMVFGTDGLLGSQWD